MTSFNELSKSPPLVVTSFGSPIALTTLMSLLLISTLSSSIFLPTAKAFHCKFPNEGCDVNKGKECCSGKCVDLHPGTNARCTRLSLHKPCLYTYQCDDRLRCGANNTCCSKYWGTCTKADDCCDPEHVCYEVEGFYYKRCLYPTGSAGTVHAYKFLPFGSPAKLTHLSSILSIVLTVTVHAVVHSLWRTY